MSFRVKHHPKDPSFSNNVPTHDAHAHSQRGFSFHSIILFHPSDINSLRQSIYRSISPLHHSFTTMMMIRRAATRTALSARSVASRSRMAPAASHLRSVYSAESLSSSTAFSNTSLQKKAWLSTSSAVSMPSPPTSNHPHHKFEGAEGMIIYTETDEAPALATYSLYPVIAKVRLLWPML